jgi:hypothetical protein
MEGFASTGLRSPVQYIDVTIVLVDGTNNDYAAYLGVGSDKFIAERGNKLTFEEAKTFFPSIEEEKYRR